MQTIATASDPAQLLSLVPALVGCRPTRSLVLIPLRDATSLGALRVDLGPDAAETADLTASTLIGMMCRVQEANALVAVVYTDVSAAPGLPYRTLIDALRVRADACGLRLVDALTVAADGWGSHLDADRRVRALDELGTASDSVPVAGVGLVTGDQNAGTELPEVSEAERRAMREAQAQLTRALEILTDVEAPSTDGSGPVSAPALQIAGTLTELPLLYEVVLEVDADDLPPLTVALLAWCLARPSMRDIALVQWSADLELGEQADAAQQRWEGGDEYPMSLAERLWGEGEQPDPARLQRALALARRVAALAPDQAGPLAVCAWLSWALGRSTHADQYARRARAVDPANRLAEIVQTFTAKGHLPDWAFRGRGRRRSRRR